MSPSLSITKTVQISILIVVPKMIKWRQDFFSTISTSTTWKDTTKPTCTLSNTCWVILQRHFYWHPNSKNLRKPNVNPLLLTWYRWIWTLESLRKFSRKWNKQWWKLLWSEEVFTAFFVMRKIRKWFRLFGKAPMSSITTVFTLVSLSAVIWLAAILNQVSTCCSTWKDTWKTSRFLWDA